MLDVRRLKLLWEFSRAGSITAAAAVLGYSPSAVSQQLAVLEREVGVPLLERTARSAELTELGQVLAAHAARILAAVESAESELAERAGTPSGRVVIAAFPTAAVALAPAVVRCLRPYPDVTVLIRQGKPERNLHDVGSGDADIAVVDDWFGTLPGRLTADVRAVLVRRDRLVLAVSRDDPLAEESGPVEIAALGTQRWVAAPEDEPSRQALDRMLAEAGASAQVALEFEGMQTVLALVAQGIGIAVVPELALAGFRDRLVTRPLAGTGLSRDVYAVVRTASARRPAISLILNAMRENPPELIES